MMNTLYIFYYNGFTYRYLNEYIVEGQAEPAVESGRRRTCC